jgi:hypothetical protein
MNQHWDAFLEHFQWPLGRELGLGVQWETVFKRTQWNRYQALEAPGQAACLACTGTALPLSSPLELPRAREDTLTWPL